MKTDAWEGLRQALVAQKEKRPSGDNWLTKEEIAKKLGMTHSGAESMIRRDRLKFESFDGWAVSRNKLVRRVWWRPINPQPIPRHPKQVKSP
jgi:hypothetical protein